MLSAECQCRISGMRRPSLPLKAHSMELTRRTLLDRLAWKASARQPEEAKRSCSRCSGPQQ